MNTRSWPLNVNRSGWFRQRLTKPSSCWLTVLQASKRVIMEPDNWMSNDNWWSDKRWDWQVPCATCWQNSLSSHLPVMTGVWSGFMVLHSLFIFNQKCRLSSQHFKSQEAKYCLLAIPSLLLLPGRHLKDSFFSDECSKVTTLIFLASRLKWWAYGHN